MTFLYRVVSFDPKKKLDEDGSIRFSNFTSFTTNPLSQHSEFGSYVLVVEMDKICNRYDCYEVEYSLSGLLDVNPSLLLKVTGKDKEEWIEWARDDFKKIYGDRDPEDWELECLIDDAIYNLYSWENEVVVHGLPVVIYLDDVTDIKELSEVLNAKSVRNKTGSGWFGEPQRHALAARGVRTR